MNLNKKEAASQQTIEQLLVISRKHFTIYGYNQSSLEMIGEEAGLTRGAIYIISTISKACLRRC